MDWHGFYRWIGTHKGLVSLGGLVSAGGAAVKIWKWFIHWYDGKVLSLMLEASRKARLEHPTIHIALLPFKIEDIAKETNRTHKRVYQSLRRLEAQGKVHEVKMGEWNLGSPQPKDKNNASTTRWKSRW